MANVNSEVTITLQQEEKELLEKALKKIDDIAEDVRNDTDILTDSDSIFMSLLYAYRDNKEKLPTVIDIWE